MRRQGCAVKHLFTERKQGTASAAGQETEVTDADEPTRQLGVTFDNTQLTSNSDRYTYNLNSSLAFTITQPLLRGFGIELNRRFIRLAKNNEKIADLVFRQQVIVTAAGIARLPLKDSCR
jgi:hypothetical protein